MKTFDLVKDAFTNTRRNKARTNLTVIAVFIGAFTLTLTNSIGTGVSTYIDGQLGQIGQGNTISVSKVVDDVVIVEGPRKYEKTSISASDSTLSQAGSATGFEMGPLTSEDIDVLSGLKHVDYVEPTILANPDYIMGDNGEKYVVTPNIAASVMTPDLAAGAPFTKDTDEYQVILPPTYVEALGYKNASDAVGKKVTLGISDVLKTEHEVEATVIGVNNKSLFGESISLNSALSVELVNLSKIGLPEDMKEDVYISALIFVDENVTDEQLVSLKDDIADAGFKGQTIQDQLGSIQAVIDGIVGVLNAFAIIALIAAGFGIVNTLLMSVQERTREIGLMKAMGMSSGKIYTLFSIEALLIGFIGTLIGVVTAWGVGSGINALLTDTLLADLPGLTLSLFTFSDIFTVFALVMFISFLAGTIPASNAAKQDPIDALRYE